MNSLLSVLLKGICGVENNPHSDYSTLLDAGSGILCLSLKPENNPCAGNNIVTGPGDEAGLPGHVIPEFQAQGNVPLQHQVGAASVIPGKPITVVHRDQA
jgi:hypothetical protein